MAPAFVFAGSPAGAAGLLNTATYSPSVFTPQNVSTTGAHMNAGQFEKYVVTLARQKLVHANPAWQTPMLIQPGNKPVATYFKFSELNFNDGTLLEANPDTFKLAEGVTPSHNLKMTVTQDTIVPQQYGLVVYLTDVVDSTAYLSVKTQLMEKMAWGISRILDEITRRHLKTNLSAIDLTAEGAGPITWKRLVRARAKLDAMNIMPPQSEGNLYPAIVHPYQQSDLLNDSNIKDALVQSGRMYADAGGLYGTNVLGEAAGFRFYQSTTCTVSPDSGTQTGFQNLVIGADCIAATALTDPTPGVGPNLGTVFGQGGMEAYRGGNNANNPVKLYSKGFGSGGATGDPIDQISSEGVKFTFGLKLVNPTHGGIMTFTSVYV